MGIKEGWWGPETLTDFPEKSRTTRGTDCTKLRFDDLIIW